MANGKNAKPSLYQDSTFVWYEDKNETNLEGCFQLKPAAPFATGKSVYRPPNRPLFPSLFPHSTEFAFGTGGASKDAKIHWFFCHTDQEADAWMSSILSKVKSGMGERMAVRNRDSFQAPQLAQTALTPPPERRRSFDSEDRFGPPDALALAQPYCEFVHSHLRL